MQECSRSDDLRLTNVELSEEKFRGDNHVRDANHFNAAIRQTNKSRNKQT